MKRLVIHPYKMGLKSVKGFKDHFQDNCLVLKSERTAYRPRDSDLFVNWGRSNTPFKGLNSSAVSIASDKVKTFGMAKQLYLDDVFLTATTDFREAKHWASEGKLLVARQLVRSSGGKGIQFVTDDNIDEFESCPLFTQYFPKKEEFRVHVFNKQIIAYQRKALKYPELNSSNWKVRNINNGFVFVRNGFELPTMVKLAIGKVQAVFGLDFFAADVLMNVKREKALICELNTAPALEGQTLTEYCEQFQKLMDE